MPEPPKRDPDDLSESEARYIVEGICGILWPRGREDEPWSPDTLDASASLMDQYRLRP